jgi:hypothetical protein
MRQLVDQSKRSPQLRWYHANPANREKSKEAIRKWRANNPERARELSRQAKARSRRKNPDAEGRRVYQRKFKYGLTPEAFDAMLAGQDGKCKICKQPSDQWHVDHCHVTGNSPWHPVSPLQYAARVRQRLNRHISVSNRVSAMCCTGITRMKRRTRLCSSHNRVPLKFTAEVAHLPLGYTGCCHRSLSALASRLRYSWSEARCQYAVTS